MHKDPKSLSKEEFALKQAIKIMKDGLSLDEKISKIKKIKEKRKDEKRKRYQRKKS